MWAKNEGFNSMYLLRGQSSMKGTNTQRISASVFLKIGGSVLILFSQEKLNTYFSDELLRCLTSRYKLGTFISYFKSMLQNTYKKHD